MSRTILVDPALKGLGSHHLNMAVALLSAATSVGHKMVWVGHRELDRSLIPANVGFVPAFSSTIYQNQIGIFGRALKRLIGDRHFLRKVLHERSWEINLRRNSTLRIFDGDRLQELTFALDAECLSATDRLVVHSADPQTVDMLTTWASRRHENMQPAIHIRTCWSSENMPFVKYGGGFAEAARRLAAVGRHVTFSSETEQGARALADATGLKVGVCPPFVDPVLRGNTNRRSESGKILVGWLGDPRQEKGAALLPEVIRHVQSSVSPAQIGFVLQCAGKEKRWLSELNAKLDEFGDSVERLPYAMSRQRYLDALRQCDVVLLPYDPRGYPPERGSGVAIEALLAGKPIVATAGTFAASIVKPDSGQVASESFSLAQGILHIAAEFERFQAGALREREYALAKYDPIALYMQLVGSGRE